MPDPIEELRGAINSAAEALRDGAGGRLAPTLERPPAPELGDYSTNAAMLLAPARGEPPREVAERLREELLVRLGDSLERIEVAGPGFVNVFLADRWHRQGVAALLGAGERFGANTATRPERILIEFVSANPTGPLTVASGRGAAYGDSLARLLELAGHEVEREYLLNDLGGQVDRFAASVAARMEGREPPDDGYSGEYVGELASELSTAGVDPQDLDAVARRATDSMRERIHATLERFGVLFDTWLRTTAFGDDKDRVLIRSGGAPTYFGADIAYHRDKLERGAERLIDPLGADHHGYLPRMRAALAALGYDPARFEAPIMQLVRLVEGTERARMSKRRGEFVTLDELIDDIGVDAARFFVLQRSHDTAFDLDLALARRQSQDNPVYYVQYAHARIASILRKSVAEGSAPPGGDGRADEAALAAAATADAALAAPPSGLRHRDGSGLSRLLPRLSGRRGGRRPRALAAGHLRGRQAGHRPHAGVARGECARTDVTPITGRGGVAPRKRCAGGA